jgi:MFS family permease
MSRLQYRRELAAWMLLPAMLAVIEGGVVGVLAKYAFEGVVATRNLNIAVAILATAPAFANVTSFVWAAINHGRAKIRFIVSLQVVTAGLVAAIAFVPQTGAGLVMLTAAAVLARVCWSGVITIRSTLWRVNYPRTERARLAGKMATAQALIITLVALGVGAAMRTNLEAFRFIYPVAAGVGLIGTWVFSGLRVRRHRALVRAEQEEHTQLATLLGSWRILLTDRRYGCYQACMFVFGLGNLMIMAPLVIMLRDRFGMNTLESVLITTTLPTTFMILTIPIWSRLLDRMDIVRFRSFHSWWHVSAIVLFFAGAMTMHPWLMFLGGMTKGSAYGGGALSWNLGHHDFAPRHQASRYMGVHVTLTGIRGLIAPLIAVGLYEMLEASREGSGPWVLAFAMALATVGGLGFVAMRIRAGRDA